MFLFCGRPIETLSFLLYVCLPFLAFFLFLRLDPFNCSMNIHLVLIYDSFNFNKILYLFVVPSTHSSYFEVDNFSCWSFTGSVCPLPFLSCRMSLRGVIVAVVALVPYSKEFHCFCFVLVQSFNILYHPYVGFQLIQ